MSEIDELLQEFLVESYENLDRLDGELLLLESQPSDRETLSSIFRTIHTIKGTCGFLDLSGLESVTHVGENLLSSLRDGRVGMNEEITSVLLELVDAVREMLAHLEQHGVEGGHTYDDLVEKLKAMNGEFGAESPDPDEGPANRSSEGVSEHEDHDPSENGEALVEDKESDSTDGLQSQAETETSQLAATNIRVQVQQLDKLMNLAGELVLARNQILQLAASSQDTATIATTQRLNLITTELQERIMKIRMQPIGSLWSKFPRVVRDLARSCGKAVELVMVGSETELDKTLLEAIKDPLTHILRNAVDHGIEGSADRVKADKQEAGMVTIRAYHESGQVNIDVSDDGRGISDTALRKKAVQSGLLSEEEAANLSPRQAIQLIFHPGLSTAAEITNVSGRGVGMDVVRSNIENIGGSVEVTSELGVGTTIRIKIPLTLAIIPALIVTSAGDRYAIPQISLVELVRLEGREAAESIEELNGSPIFRLRGELLPLVSLNETLALASDEGQIADGGTDRALNIVVVRADQTSFGLAVDEINDTEEIVVKPLDQQLKAMDVYAGTTILGDGRVALIVDALGLAQREEILDHVKGSRLETGDEGDESLSSTETFLLVEPRPGRRVAIEISEVARLEEIQASAFEKTGPFEVVQYRGGIMPVLRLGTMLGYEDSVRDGSEDETIHVVVRNVEDGHIGLVVDSITDIVETRGATRRPLDDPALSASIVIDGRVADLLDTRSMAEEVASSHRKVASNSAPNEADGQAVGHEQRQLCTFYVDHLMFGVDVTSVQEVLRFQPMTRIPLAPNVVEGLINLRGQIVTAIDLRRRLAIGDGGPEDSLDNERMNVVLRQDGDVVSILVDRIGDVLLVDEATYGSVPRNVESPLHDLLRGVYKLDSQLLLEIDLERLLGFNDRVSDLRPAASH